MHKHVFNENRELFQESGEWQHTPAPHHSREHFPKIYEKYYGLVLHFFHQRKYATEDARDMTQETFIRVLKGLRQFRGDASPRNWIMKIAANLFINEIKKKNSVNSGNTSVVGLEHMEDIPTANSSPERIVHEMEEKERKKRLSTAMASLSPRMRHCISLRILQQLKYTEIAVIMKAETNTIKSLLFQAKAKLKQMLTKEEETAND